MRMNQEIIDNLVAAVNNCRTDIILSVLSTCEKSLKADLLASSCNSSGTLLHLATQLNHIDIVRALLSSGAEPQLKNAEELSSFNLSRSPEMTAVYIDELLKCSAESNIKRIENLISAGVDVNSQDSPEGKNTALHWAISFGEIEAIKCVLELGANPNAINGTGLTPLHQAVLHPNAAYVKLLLDAGADPKTLSFSEQYLNKTAIELASGNKEILALCLRHAQSDSESEKSVNGSQAEQSESDNVDAMSTSLQSLSTSTEPAYRSSLSQTSPIGPYVPPFLMTPLPLVTDSKLHLLWPQPQKIVQADDEFHKLQTKYSVQMAHTSPEISAMSVLDVWNTHSPKFEFLGRELCLDNFIQSKVENSGDIVCSVNPQLFQTPESYKLVISKDQIRILSADVIGVHYALHTLEQLFTFYHEDDAVPSLTVHDWPQFQHRAVLLDFSYGARKPSMETLKDYVLIMSSLKMKQLHCYFRYEQSNGHKLSFTDNELVELCRFCAQHFITVVPTLDVEPQFDPVRDEVKEILADYAYKLTTLFSAKSIHLGPFLSDKLLLEVHRARSFQVVWDTLQLPSHILLYMSYKYVDGSSEELMQLLPFNCVLIDFGYEVDHDYDSHAKRISQFGLHVSLGSSTSVWRSIAGSPEKSIACIQKAVLSASSCNAFGLIVADWQSNPQLSTFSFSWPAVLLSVGLAWNSTVHEDYIQNRLPELLNYHVFKDPADVTGYLNIEIGRLEEFMHSAVYRSGGNEPCMQTSVVYCLLVDPDAVLLDHFSLDLLQKVMRHVKEFESELQKATPNCIRHEASNRNINLVISELKLSMDIIMFVCRLSKVMVSTGLNPAGNSCGLAVINVGIGNLPPITRTDLANRLLDLIEQFRSVWLSRSQPCGLQNSLSMFTSLLLKLIPKADDASSETGQLPMFQNLFASDTSSDTSRSSE